MRRRRGKVKNMRNESRAGGGEVTGRGNKIDSNL